MLIETSRQRLVRLFDRIETVGGPMLPFRGRYLRAFRDLALGNLAQIQAQVGTFLESGDYEGLVRFLVAYARGNLKVPFPLSLFTGTALTAIETWALANKGKLADLIGDARPGV